MFWQPPRILMDEIYVWVKTWHILSKGQDATQKIGFHSKALVDILWKFLLQVKNKSDANVSIRKPSMKFGDATSSALFVESFVDWVRIMLVRITPVSSTGQGDLEERGTIWQQHGTTCIRCKFDHQITPLALVANLATRWRHLHCIQRWPPDCVTCIATLPWIALLALSVSIELVSSSARVTSVKSQQGLLTQSLTEGHPDPKIGPQVYLVR